MNLEGAWESVEKFVESLKEALVEEMKTIRETELDHSGGFRSARLRFKGSLKLVKPSTSMVFVDRLGRVITPIDSNWENLESVQFVGGKCRQVVSSETRYEGDQKVAIVHYLEKEESHEN